MLLKMRTKLYEGGIMQKILIGENIIMFAKIGFLPQKKKQSRNSLKLERQMSKPYYETEEYSVSENELDTYDDPVKLVMEYRISEKHKDQQIADLQHRLDIAEKALYKMSNYAINDNDLYDLVIDFNVENERYDEYHLGVYTYDIVDYFKEQAEKEVKGG